MIFSYRVGGSGGVGLFYKFMRSTPTIAVHFNLQERKEIFVQCRATFINDNTV